MVGIVAAGPAESDASLAERIAWSLGVDASPIASPDRFDAWYARQRETIRQRVDRVPLAALDRWQTAPGTGDLVHETGRFFAVRGLSVRCDYGPVPAWQQPILSQPEIGILGLLLRDVGGVLHCLVQAKAEPGNANGVQLSPTVQATRSNYSRVHGGTPVPYLELFRHADSHQVVADTLQSEQGSWFYRKRNRNMLVETTDEVPVRDRFHWLTLGQLHRMLAADDVVNMDTRTVLSCLPGPPPVASAHPDRALLSWITGRRTAYELHTELLGLGGLEGWRRTHDAIEHEQGRHFRIVGVRVVAGSREVARWSQPLLEPRGTGVAAMLMARIAGVPHVLVHARVEPGYRDVVELGPTAQAIPDNRTGDQPRYLAEALAAQPDRVLYDTVLSEEGGRFHHAHTRYLVVQVEHDRLGPEPDTHRWVTLPQLAELVRNGYVNVQARTLLAAMRGPALRERR